MFSYSAIPGVHVLQVFAGDVCEVVDGVDWGWWVVGHVVAREEAGEGTFFRTPDEVADYYMEDLRHEEQEVLLLLMLNQKGRLLKEKYVFRGTVNASIVSPREIFLEALAARAVQIILLHNHPSGDARPSREDLNVTKRIQEAGELLGIHLTDHIIIGEHAYVSLREKNYL